MKYAELQKKSDKELKKSLAANSESMRKYRFDTSGASSSNDTQLISNTRKANARILTELNTRAKASQK